MPGKTILLVAALALSGAASAQEPANPTASPAAPARAVAPPAPVAGDGFRAGAEVLSVDGEPLGVLAYVDTLEGERTLHIRRSDGTVTAVPSTVASQGERAVVLEWTRAEFETPSPSVAPSVPPPPQ